MEILGTLFEKTMQIFRIELTLWGFTFSFWEVFAFVLVAGVLAWIIGEVFLGD